MDALGRLLTDALAERGWSQAELSRRSGVPLTTINGWITGARAKGSRGPSPAKLRSVAEALGKPPLTVLEAAGRTVPAELTEDEERRFLDMYRALSKDGRVMTMAGMRAYLEAQREKS